MKAANDEMREASIRAHQKFKSYREPCMYPGGCTNPSVRAHAVQRKGPLALVAEGGFVAAPDIEVAKSLDDDPEIRINARTGWKKATTFWALCKQHDDMFVPIENGPLNYSHSEHTFLLSYRACLKSVHDLHRNARWYEFGAEQLEKRGLVPPRAVNPMRVQAQQVAATNRPAEHLKDLLGKAYLACDHARLEHEVFGVPGVGGAVAASGMFYDRKDANGTPAFLIVNLVPEANRHVLLLSYLRGQRDAHQPYIDLINTRFELSLRQLISRLLVMRIRSFALRPSLWNPFTSAQRGAIKNALAQPAYPGDLAAVSDPNINLFEIVS